MFEVRILGSSAAIPVGKRRPTSQVITYHDRHYMIDCGEGAQMQMSRYRLKFSRLDAIFISHMHGDHVHGLPGLLSTMSLLGRNFPLKIFGPKDLKAYLDTSLGLTHSQLNYEWSFEALEDFAPGETLLESRSLKITSFPLSHRIFCKGFRFQEHSLRPRFNYPSAVALEVPKTYFKLLKQGNTITLEDGRVILPEQVLLPAKLPRSYGYASDTAFAPDIVPYIEGVDLLYHEATFMQDMALRASETHHSTTQQAAEIAQQAKVGQLLIGHFSARYSKLELLLEEAQAVFPNTALAREGDLFIIPSQENIPEQRSTEG